MKRMMMKQQYKNNNATDKQTNKKNKHLNQEKVQEQDTRVYKGSAGRSSAVGWCDGGVQARMNARCGVRYVVNKSGDVQMG
jgi:hypothetical protein